MNNALFAFLLTLFAGLFTGVGGLAALFSKRNNTRFLALCLSFAAGVMLYVSFAEIFAKALESLSGSRGHETGYLITTVAFFGGIILIGIIDTLVPRSENHVQRTGVMSAVAIAVHNFPEGLVTFIAALYDPALGVSIAIAIAVHNIPEGIAIAAPIYYATGSKKKALLAAAASGATEPLGALAAYFFLSNALNESIFGISFAVAGGIMVYIAVHQLLPAAAEYGKHSTVTKGLFAGMGVMALSLIIF